MFCKTLQDSNGHYFVELSAKFADVFDLYFQGQTLRISLFRSNYKTTEPTTIRLADVRAMTETYVVKF